MIEQLNRLHKDRVNIKITNGEFGRWYETFSVTLTRRDDGINICIETEATSLEEAVQEAYDKFYRVVTTGAPASFITPQIEHQPVDDDIPY